MKLSVYQDPTKWGHAVAIAAMARGHQVVERDADVAYVRLLTFEPERSLCFQALRQYQALGIPTLPGKDADWYDDKRKQVDILAPWLPKTYHHTQPPSWPEILSYKYPMVSKSHTGAQSRNVRMIYEAGIARKEVNAAFHGTGIPLQPNGRQRGYVLWQEFIPGNDGDIRVCVTGDVMFGLRRYNRDDKPFASGSGRHAAILDLDHRSSKAFELASLISQELDTRWQCYDFVFDHEERCYCLEASSSWVAKAYNDCPLFHREGLVRMKGTARMWPSLLVNELERVAGCS